MKTSPGYSRRAVLAAGTAWALCGCASHSTSPVENSDSTPSATSSTVVPSSPPATPSSSPSAHIDRSAPESLGVLVNKHHPMNPQNWAPADLVNFSGVQLRAEAAEAASKLFAAASETGLALKALSGFRSFETQQQTYQHWVSTQGQEHADVASARPGYSEHQTGLAMDIGTGSGCDLQVCFAQTPEAQWLAENAYRFGFILRFPYWQHEVTGYWFESWHYRYLGVDEAHRYRDSTAKSLEEFWGADSAPNYL